MADYTQEKSSMNVSTVPLKQMAYTVEQPKDEKSTQTNSEVPGSEGELRTDPDTEDDVLDIYLNRPPVSKDQNANEHNEENVQSQNAVPEKVMDKEVLSRELEATKQQIQALKDEWTKRSEEHMGRDTAVDIKIDQLKCKLAKSSIQRHQIIRQSLGKGLPLTQDLIAELSIYSSADLVREAKEVLRNLEQCNKEGRDVKQYFDKTRMEIELLNIKIKDINKNIKGL